MKNNNFKRIFVIVADSLGIGEAPDAKKYNDLGANTFGHIANLSTEFHIPTLQKLGIGNICANNKIKASFPPIAVVARMQEQSVGKDTLTGHYEMMRSKVTNPYASQLYFLFGFPPWS